MEPAPTVEELPIADVGVERILTEDEDPSAAAAQGPGFGIRWYDVESRLAKLEVDP